MVEVAREAGMDSEATEVAAMEVEEKVVGKVAARAEAGWEEAVKEVVARAEVEMAAKADTRKKPTNRKAKRR